MWHIRREQGMVAAFRDDLSGWEWFDTWGEALEYVTEERQKEKVTA